MDRLRGFRRKFRFPWRSIRQIRRDVDDEVAFHLAERTAALQREGLSLDEAREEALRQFGDVAMARRRLIDDNRRGERHSAWGRILDDLARDVKHAWRSLGRSPGFTAVAVLVLSLGIGVASMMFSLVDLVVLRPVSIDEPDELVSVYSQSTEVPDLYRGFSYAEYAQMSERNNVFSDLAAHNVGVTGIGDGEVTRRVLTAFVSANYFRTLGVPPERGRAFTVAEERGEDRPAVVVSHDFWVRNGSDPGLLGSSMRVNGQSLVVVGIAAERFTGTIPVLTPEIWVPLAFLESVRLTEDGEPSRLSDPMNRALILFGRRGDDVTMLAVETDLRALATRIEANLPPPDAEPFTYIATPMPRLAISNGPQDSGELAAPVVLVMSMSAVVLLIACLNLANMFLARGASRRTEMAIRESLGSGRARLVRQLLTEGLLLAIAGGAVGLLGAYWAAQRIVVSVAEIFPLDAGVVIDAGPDLPVLLFTAATCVIATLLFGLGPAWRVTGSHLLGGLAADARRDAFWSGPGNVKLLSPRRLMIVAQIALSSVMLTAGGLFLRAALIAADATPGFSVDSALLVELDTSLIGYDESRTRGVYGRVLDRLRALPEVRNAATASQVPFSGIGNKILVRRAGPVRDGDVALAHYYVVGDGYFDTLRLPLLRGREFTATEAAFEGGGRVAIVDEPLARQLFGDREALGRTLRFVDNRPTTDTAPIEIVGIAIGTRHELNEPSPSAHIYVPFGQAYVPGQFIHLGIDERVANPAGLLETVREEIRRVDAALPVLTLTTLRDFRDGSIELWLVRLGGLLFTWLGVAALFMALVGVYGVTAFLTSRRTREIGVRMALGATRAMIMRHIIRESLSSTVFGLALGLVLAAAVAQLLSSMLYEVNAMDPIVFAGATAFLAASAMIASYLPVRRASRVEPTVALRYE